MDWYEHYEAAMRHLRSLEDSFPDADFRPEGDWLQACRTISTFQDHFGEVAVHCAQQAYSAGATKKDVAAALSMPVSTLRGMVRS
jgi:hypothetical protein